MTETPDNVEKPPTTEEQRQGDPADEPVAPFQANPNPVPQSFPENPPQPPEPDDEEDEEEDDE